MAGFRDIFKIFGSRAEPGQDSAAPHDLPDARASRDVPAAADALTAIQLILDSAEKRQQTTIRNLEDNAAQLRAAADKLIAMRESDTIEQTKQYFAPCISFLDRVSPLLPDLGRYRIEDVEGFMNVLTISHGQQGKLVLFPTSDGSSLYAHAQKFVAFGRPDGARLEVVDCDAAVELIADNLCAVYPDKRADIQVAQRADTGLATSTAVTLQTSAVGRAEPVVVKAVPIMGVEPRGAK